MSLIINSNLSSLIVQRKSNDSPLLELGAVENLTKDYKIVDKVDISPHRVKSFEFQTKIEDLEAVSKNSSLGSGLLNTLKSTYQVIHSNLDRINELSNLVQNNFFDKEMLESVEAEINSRIKNINESTENLEFNGVKLLNGSRKSVNIQLGSTHSLENVITLNEEVFGDVETNTKNLIGDEWTDESAGKFVCDNSVVASRELNVAMEVINTRLAHIEDYKNQLETTLKNITESEEEAESNNVSQYGKTPDETIGGIRNEIVKNAAVALLTTTNFTPDMALQLL